MLTQLSKIIFFFYKSKLFTTARFFIFLSMQQRPPYIKTPLPHNLWYIDTHLWCCK